MAAIQDEKYTCADTCNTADRSPDSSINICCRFAGGFLSWLHSRDAVEENGHQAGGVAREVPRRRVCFFAGEDEMVGLLKVQVDAWSLSDIHKTACRGASTVYVDDIILKLFPTTNCSPIILCVSLFWFTGARHYG